jgi:hypothetical protein
LKCSAKGMWYWDDCLGSKFDLMENVVFKDDVSLPENESVDDVLVRDLMNTELPFDKPLWRAYVYEKEGRTFVVFKIHHSISDGPGLSLVFGRMIDDTESAFEVAQMNRRRQMSMEAKNQHLQKRSLFWKVLSWLQTLFYVLLVFYNMIVFAVTPMGKKDWIFDRDDESFPARRIVKTLPINLETVISFE